MSITESREEAKRILDRLSGEALEVARILLSHLANIEGKGALPEEPYWIGLLSEKDRQEFLRELKETLEKASESGHWQEVQGVIDSWEETAYIVSDKELMAAIQQAEEELVKGEVASWEEIKAKLHLP